ncbi:MAG: hypothetical protein OXG42_08080, partial [Chloroflexi bacterium]|nr:hypothetical protein [Chloroflexota bacterium]
PEFFGRVMSFVVLGFAAQSLLGPIWGISADGLGDRETMFLVGMIVLATTVLLSVAWRRTRRMPLEVGTPAALAAAGPTQGSPRSTPSPAFGAQLAPVARMGGQKRRATTVPGGD